MRPGLAHSTRCLLGRPQVAAWHSLPLILPRRPVSSAWPGATAPVAGLCPAACVAGITWASRSRGAAAAAGSGGRAVRVAGSPGPRVAVGPPQQQALVAGQHVRVVVLHEAAHSHKQHLALQVEFGVLGRGESGRVGGAPCERGWSAARMTARQAPSRPVSANPRAHPRPRQGLPSSRRPGEGPACPPSQRCDSSSLCWSSRPTRPEPAGREAADGSADSSPSVRRRAPDTEGQAEASRPSPGALTAT